MVQTVLDTTKPAKGKNPAHPNAPLDWSLEKAVELARDEGITLTEEHVSVLLVLQDYFANHEGRTNFRELHDALDEEFHVDGGIKHLYKLFPGGPIAQGCRIAGLEVPAYAEDDNFGTVM